MKHSNFVALSFIILAITAMLSPNVANTQACAIKSNQFGTRLSVSHKWYYEITTDFCGGDFYFNYRQRVTIDDGKSEFVPTLFVLQPKEYSLELVGFCEGYYYYYVFSLPREVSFDLENSAMFVRADNKRTKICKLVQSR